MDSETKKLVLAALVVMLGGNAGNIIHAINPPEYRPFPFTSLDAKDLKEELSNELEDVRTRLTKAELRVDECLRRTEQ